MANASRDDDCVAKRYVRVALDGRAAPAARPRTPRADFAGCEHPESRVGGALTAKTGSRADRNISKPVA